MAWNMTYILQNDQYCDLEDCTDSSKVECILICGYAYHFEYFLFNLRS